MKLIIEASCPSIGLIKLCLNPERYSSRKLSIGWNWRTNNSQSGSGNRFALDFTDAIFNFPVVHVKTFSLLSQDTVYVPEGVRVLCKASSFADGVKEMFNWLVNPKYFKKILLGHQTTACLSWYPQEICQGLWSEKTASRAGKLSSVM